MEQFVFSLVSSIFLLISVLFVKGKVAKLFFVMMLSAVIGLSLLYLVSDYYTGVGVTEATVFHLLYGWRGVPLNQAIYLASVVVAYAFVIIIIIGVFFKCRLEKYLPFQVAAFLTAASLSFFAIATHPSVAQLINIYCALSSGRHSDYLDVEVVNDDYVLVGEAGKSLIYIYLESYEQTLFDNRIFPGLVTNLVGIRDKALTFSNIQQSPLTQWTMAGIAASQCGVPMANAKLNRPESEVSKFLIPGHVCISDILSRSGYSISYMGGADIAFSSKDVFLRNHNFDHVYGLSYFKSEYPEVPTSSWGVYDDYLFQQAKEAIEAELMSGALFAFFMLTLDTHSPNGHRTPSCKEDDNYSSHANPMMNSVKCVDRLTSEFIVDLQTLLEKYNRNDVVIVVASDHLQMQSTIFSELIAHQDKRRNLFFIIDPDQQGRIIDKAGTTMDIAPTLLSVLGWDVTSLALGRNLLSEKETLIEKYGTDDFFNMIMGWQQYLWRTSVQGQSGSYNKGGEL